MQSISDTSSRNASESVAANELAVRKACSFQRGFLQVYVRTVAVLQNAVDERGALQRNAADAAGKAAVSKRQPGEVARQAWRFS